MDNTANFRAPNNGGFNVGQNYGHINVSSNQQPKKDVVRECVDALFVTDARADRASITSTKGHVVPGTCDWIDRNPLYRGWLKDSSSSFCIVGGPGKGKTMLAVHLTTNLEAMHHRQQLTLTYFFCDHRDPRRNSACAILRTLLCQILAQHPTLVTFVTNCMGDSKNADKRAERVLTSRDALWLILSDMLRCSELQDLICVIDGLDECEEDSVWLAEKISGLHTACDTDPVKPRFLVISRKLMDLEELPQIDLDVLDDTGFRTSMTKFVVSRLDGLDKISGFSGNFRTKVHNNLLERCEGSFLWLGCVVEELRRKKTCTDVQRCLNNLPKGLRPLYDRLLTKIHEQDRAECGRILQWVAQAMRPITIAELAEAVEVDETEDIPTEQAVKDRITWCGSLLRLDPPQDPAREIHSVVALVHYSLREYLLDTTHSLRSGLTNFFFSSQNSHYSIALRCIEYLQQTRPQELHWSCDRGVHNSLALTEYATVHWPSHARLAGDETLNLMHAHAKFFGQYGMAYTSWWWSYRCATNAKLRYQLPKLIDDYPIQRVLQTIQPFHLAAALGIMPWMEDIVSHTTPEDDVTNLKDLRDHLPLHYATQRGHIAPIKLLLQLGAIVDERSVFAACSEGHTEVLSLLLDNGGNPNARALDIDESGTLQETALLEAAGCGHEEIVRILLQHGADPNALSPDRKGPDTPEQIPAFVMACSGGSVNILETLLPLTDNLDDHIAKSFMLAVCSNHEPIIRLLCPHLKRIKSKNADLRKFLRLGLKFDLSTSALIHILEYFQMSVDTTVVEIKEGIKGFKPILIMSINQDRSDLASSLLQKGAQLEPDCSAAEAAVHLATKYDEIALLEQLKSRGVLMGALRKTGTSMHTAAASNSVAAAQYLHANKVSLAFPNFDGQTPLHIAAAKGNLNMLTFLLEKEVNALAEDNKGKTALNWAREQGHGEAARMLQEHAEKAARG